MIKHPPNETDQKEQGYGKKLRIYRWQSGEQQTIPWPIDDDQYPKTWHGSNQPVSS